MKLKKLLAGLILALAVATPSFAKDKIRVGASLPNDTNPFYISVKNGIQARANQVGATVTFVTANEDISKQIAGIEDMIERGVDALLISPIDSIAIGGVYEKAAKAGIPVISVVRTTNSPYQKRSVSMNWVQVGNKVGDFVAGKIGGKGKVAMIDGPAGSMLFQDLSKGFRDVMATHPGIKIVFAKETPGTRETGLKAAEDALIANNDIVAIFTANDEAALGAMQAVGVAGKTKDIVITGLNGVPSALRAVQMGTMALTVALNGPGWGAVGLDTAVAYAKGQTPTDEQIAVPYEFVTKDNVANFLK